MKKIYASPEIKALEVKAEDIITLSYMLPDIPVDTGSETNSSSIME